MKSIVFVCTGNTCRSPIAQGLLTKMLKTDSNIVAVSAGIQATSGLPASSMTLRVLMDEGIDFTQFQSQLVTVKLLEKATCEKYYLLTEWTTQKDVSDPFGGSLKDYQECCATIKSCIEKIIPFIESQSV
eukprot:gene17998-23636_t